MRNFVYVLALMAAVASCDNSRRTGTSANNGTAAPLSNQIPGQEAIDMEALANQPLSKGAEKYKGEYQLQDDDGVKSYIREHPEKPGLLAVTTHAGNREPVTIAYWYNEVEDALSSKQVKGQPKFTTLKLDPTGETMLNIHHDWNRNLADTTVYKRIK
jgi:hypothetical protein